MRDMLSNKQVVLIGTVTLSGTTPGATSWVDIRGFDACTLVLATDTVTDAGDASGFTFTAQHGDTAAASGAAAIDAADSVDGAIALSVTADADDNKVIGGIGYKGNKRYVRMRGVGTTGTDATVKVFAILNKPHRAETTFVGTAVAAT
jgi:hypothetical protein